jgi:hypothetical protein
VAAFVGLIMTGAAPPGSAAARPTNRPAVQAAAAPAGGGTVADGERPAGGGGAVADGATRPEPAPPNLFGQATPTRTQRAEKLEPWEIRRRLATVDWRLLRPLCAAKAERAGRRMTLNVFPDMAIVAEQGTAGNTFRKDSLQWSGGASQAADSSITLTAIGLCAKSSRRAVLSGSIKLNGAEYTIQPRPGGQVAITEINSLAAGLAQKPDRIEPPKRTRGQHTKAPPAPSRPAAPSQGGRPVIDALILYTPGAVKRAGGVDEIQSWIQDAAARANGNLARSDVKASFRVVHMDEAKGYRGGETVRPAFNHLADPRDGMLDEAATLRNKYGADIVTTVVKGYDPKDPIAGLASYPENPKNPATSDEIWSVVAANQLWAYVLAHEWGHLLGLTHDWKTSPEKNPYYPDNHAYVAPDSAFVTIMGYPSSCRTPCPYAGYFANPHLTYDGRPLGVKLGAGRLSADNTRVMNLTAPQVAAYRKPKVTLPDHKLTIAAAPAIGGAARPRADAPHDPGALFTGPGDGRAELPLHRFDAGRPAPRGDRRDDQLWAGDGAACPDGAVAVPWAGADGAPGAPGEPVVPGEAVCFPVLSAVLTALSNALPFTHDFQGSSQ